MVRINLPPLPASLNLDYPPFRINTPGRWLVLSDVHIPFHDRKTVELAVREAKRVKVVGVLLNGDIFDCHALSRFDREPTAIRYVAERELGIAFLDYLRARFPTQQMIFKEGNHEERLGNYLIRRAQELFGLKVLSLPSLMEFERFGLEHVGDFRVIRLGRLNVIHGHEYKPTIQAPVNPARGLFLRAKSVALAGHFHQTSEHHEPRITGKPQGAWSVGCACQLNPRWMPLNKWNLGFAIVEIDSGGVFSVRNLKVIDGAVT